MLASAHDHASALPSSDRAGSSQTSCVDAVCARTMVIGGTMDDQHLLIRVKRALDAEPIPEIVVEGPRVSAKRQRPDAAAAALRLVDTVASGQWNLEGGLPTSWLRAASCAAWGAPLAQAPPLAHLANGDVPMSDQRPALQEAGRQTVTASLGASIQLIDVEPVPKNAPRAPSQPLTFTIDGQELLPVDAEHKSRQDDPAVFSGGCEAASGGFLWDVYAPVDSTWNGQLEGAGFRTFVRLAAPLLSDEDLDDLEDIDDSQSDMSDPWVHGGAGAGSSSEEDFDPQEDKPWMHELD